MKYTFFLALILSSSFTWGQAFGDKKNHPINNKSSNYDILEFWGKHSSQELELCSYVHSFFKKNETIDFEHLSKDATFQGLMSKLDKELIDGPMLGDIKTDGVSIWVRTLKPSKVDVKISGKNFSKTFGPVWADKKTDLSAVVNITGLNPDTKYTYDILIDGEKIQVSNETAFRTVPEKFKKSDINIVFGSCFHRWGLGNEKMMAAMKDKNPLAALFIGDIAVQDRLANMSLHRDDYFVRSLYHGWNDFVASVPVYATWDDHDYFKNDGAGIPKGFTYEDKKNVWQVFKNSWNNPYYGLEDNGEGIFTHTSIGPFDVIMTDNRYFRTNKKGSFLGDKQMEWLKERLLACKGDFIIVSSGSMWSDYVSEGKDSWGVNDPEGREELFQFIEENNISGVLFISGDRHGARGFTIPRKNGFNFYEFEAASLGGRIGPPATSDEWNTQLFGFDAVFAFGQFMYVAGKDPKVEFSLFDEDNKTLYKTEIAKSQLTPKNYER